MLGRIALACVGAWSAAVSGFAHAAALEFALHLSDGPLPERLSDFQRQTGVELLYDSEVIREVRSPAVSGQLTTEVALRQLLSDSDLVVRRATSGAWIIERPATAPLERQDATVAEILVVGHRTQNADIRRTEDDVQPYKVAKRDEILRAHRDNIDQFISSRITSNTTIVPSIAVQNADVNSSIDLRGLGALDTVVLVDGRRMPSIPDPDNGFKQSDLNAIPLHAIERIEVLTGTAGGIHGFGALGGVVNVVLDRDFKGLELFTTQGISSRGDSRRQSVEAKLGHAFQDGATNFTVFAAHQELDTPRVADRDFNARDRRRTFEVAPDHYPGLFLDANAIQVFSVLGVDPDSGEYVIHPNLSFKPEFGGGTLGSDHTYLPIGMSGERAPLVAALTEHAGEVSYALPDDVANGELGSNPQADSVIANLRHRFESGSEAYVDAVLLRSRGQSVNATESARLRMFQGTAFIAPDSPANPFDQYISVSWPITGLETSVRKQLDNRRYTAGFEMALPFDWRGTAEASFGSLTYFSRSFDEFPLSGISYILFGDPSDLDTNPFGDWDTFHGLATDNVFRTTETHQFHTRFRAQSLRLAGPLFETRAGASTATFLVERRSERVPAGTYSFFLDNGVNSATTVFSSRTRSAITESLYGELRSPLVDDTARFGLLRGLELQLAVRHDRQVNQFVRDISVPAADAEIIDAAFTGTTYTFGAKILPTRWLMLRGSFATGEQPPPLADLVEFEPFTTTTLGPADPKRAGTDLGADGPYDLLLGGNSKLRTARATTVYFGAVLTPAGAEGPRFSLDYSRIHRARDVNPAYDISEILAHEDDWPERVLRAPLTDADRANGYTGGRVEVLDGRQKNDATHDVEVFDASVEWPFELFGGRMRFYADATYQKLNDTRSRFKDVVHWAGYIDGPLKRRANGGFDWSARQLTVGGNLQYFGSTLIFGHNFLLGPDETSIPIQGSSRIPSQTYLDLYGSWRFATQNLGPVEELKLDFGVVNVLDKAPPRETYSLEFGPGYSRYGDPRMRRFELGISCRF